MDWIFSCYNMCNVYTASKVKPHKNNCQIGVYYIEDIWVFQCKIEFYFTKWTPQAVFSRVAVATRENTDCWVHELNKIQSYTEKNNNKFSVSFMLLFAIIMFLATRQLSRQKTYFFPSHFASISSCSACLVGTIWVKNTVLYLENEPTYHFNN